MKAIILAAGEGIRMRPLTLKTPKPLLELNGKPILEHIVSRLPAKINEIILVIGYLGKQIKDYCGDEFLGKRVRYVWQEKRLGTYHSLKLCEPLIEKGERFLTLYADDIHGKEGIENCLKYQRALIVEKVEDPRKFGVVFLNSDNTIAEIIEKPENPPSNLVSTGVLLLDSKIFKYKADLNPNGEYYLTDALSKMIKDGHQIFAVKSTLWIPIGYPEDIKKAEKIMAEQKKLKTIMQNKSKSKKSKKKKPIVVAVSGGFDPIHVGHVRMFKKAKKLGDKLVVILNNDHWLRKKRGYVFMPQEERKEIIEAIACVDRVILTSHQSNPKDMSVCTELKKIRPHIFANGGDRKLDNIPEVPVCEAIGCKMVFNIGQGGKIQSSSWLLKKYIGDRKKCHGE